MKRKMKHIMLTLAIIMAIPVSIWAQERYFTRDGKVSFNCGTALETIEGTTTGANCVLVTGTGQLQAAVLLKAFEFEKDLMERHFNENYVESDKFPKAVFAGKVVNIGEVDFEADGKYPVRLDGKFTLHGVTKDMKADGLIEVRNSKVIATAGFRVRLDDYDIERPGVVKDKIAEEATVEIAMQLEPMGGRP
jgi:hypothetical protein